MTCFCSGSHGCAYMSTIVCFINSKQIVCADLTLCVANLHDLVFEKWWLFRYVLALCLEICPNRLNYQNQRAYKATVHCGKWELQLIYLESHLFM